MGDTIGCLVFLLSALRVFRDLLPLLWCPSCTLFGSPFFFDRVHLTALTFHTFVFVSDFDTSFTFEMTFLDEAWIYIMGGTIGCLGFFVVHPYGV